MSSDSSASSDPTRISDIARMASGGQDPIVSREARSGLVLASPLDGWTSRGMSERGGGGAHIVECALGSKTSASGRRRGNAGR